VLVAGTEVLEADGFLAELVLEVLGLVVVGFPATTGPTVGTLLICMIANPPLVGINPISNVIGDIGKIFRGYPFVHETFIRSKGPSGYVAMDYNRDEHP